MKKYGCCYEGNAPDRRCTPSTCMQLPAGTTCGDCAHVERCLAIGYTSSKDRDSCDFFPRRFIDAYRGVR